MLEELADKTKEFEIVEKFLTGIRKEFGKVYEKLAKIEKLRFLELREKIVE